MAALPIAHKEPQDAIRVLLIDDEAAVRKATSQWLRLAGIDVETCANAAEALSILQSPQPCVLVSDIKMPGMDGLELARRSNQLDPDMPIILITGHGDIGMAVQAMRDGAYDFLEKPFEPELLIDRIQRAWEKRRLIEENRQLRRTLARCEGLEARLLGQSVQMQQIRRQIMQLASTPVDVMINGATGTGKDQVARCLHDWSSRAKANFVAVNCGAIPEHLFESELFGHEPGAFTGANKRRIGKLEYANGGTLFLDEIESMPLNFQIKLLRALQERRIERLGANQEVSLDLWVIAATKTDLRQASDEGKFREDLYYRLNVAELHLPTLQQRREDIPLLFEHYARQSAYNHNRPYDPPDESDLTALMTHNWPGNVRELKNLAERYVLGLDQNSSVHGLLHHTALEPAPGSNQGLSCQVQEFERQLIVGALKRHQGNVQAVLDELNIPRRTLNNKMRQYDILRKDYL